MAISLSELRNSKKQNSISIKNLKNYIENNPLSDSEKQNIYNSMLISKRKSLENQLSNYDRKEKVEWWSDDNNFFENVGNVLYKTFIERQPTKYEEDETYNKLKSEYDEINKAIEDYRLANTEYEEGILGGFQKVGDTIAGNAMSSIKGIESSINKLTGLPTNSKITYEERLAQKARQETTGIGGVGLDLVGSFTRMLPQMLAPNPITATAIGFANYGGSAYNEAKREGADETRATIYGLTVGGLEMAMSKILGGFENVYGKSALGKLNNKILSNVIKNPTLRKTISGATGEFTEEYLQQFLEPIVKNTILQEENGADFWNTMKDDIGAGLKQLSKQFFNMENLYAGLLGGISSSALQLPSNIAQSKFDSQSQISSSNINSNQSTPKTVYDLVQQEQNSQNNANLPIVDNNGNLVNPNKFQYVKSDNTKIDNLRKSANKYFNNLQDTQNLVNTIEKVIADKDYNVVFDDSIKNKNGQSVNAQITTNKNGEIEIKINPNSQRAGEFLLTHEITHAIETDSMKKLIIDYASKNTEFDQALESLKQTYGVDDVSSEVIADISGQLLGNQEFINSLTIQNTAESKSIIKTIYENIKRLLNTLTKNGRYRNFVQDLEIKWRNAYKTTTTEQAVSNLSNETKYMMTGLKGMENGITTSAKYVDIKDRYDAALYLENKNYSNEKIRQITGWFKDKEGNWEFEISDQHTKFKIQPKTNTKYKLSDIFEANTLYEMYPELKNITVEFKNLKGKSGNYNSIANKITINNTMTNNLDNLKGTLLHEIQHYIQNEEGLPTGTTILFGNEQYANSKGEIEAADTKIRRNLTVEQRKSTIPESSKSNPIHPNRDAILNRKRNAVEKIAEQIYNIFGGNSNEISEEIDFQNIEQTDEITDKLHQENKNGIKELDNSSFSLVSNAKRYDDLLKTNYIEYFRKDNGDVRVNLIDSNSNLINQLDLWSNTEAIKQFGEKLGNQLYNYATDNNQKINIGNDINNLGLETDYFMNHRPTQTGLTADDLINQNVETPMPKDIYIHPEYYFQMNEKSSQESISVLRKVRGNPNAEITIYRATPGNKINKGDWITLSKSYAEWHNQSQFDGKANILEMKVKAKDVQYAGDDINEFGYFPDGNIKNSISNKSWQDYLEQNYKATGTRTDMRKLLPTQEDIRKMELKDTKLPTRKTLNNTKNDHISNESKEIAQKLNETIQSDVISTKQRSWVETSTESDVLKDRVLIKDLDTSKINYVPISNKTTLEKANSKLDNLGYDKAVEYIQSKLNDSSISLEDIALAERLIQESAKHGDTMLAADLIMDTAILGTELGRKTQILSMIQRLTPEGQLKHFQKIVKRAKAKGEKSFQNVEITPEMVDLILKAYNQDGTYDQADLNSRVEQFKQKVADQLTTSKAEKINAWRYLSMLGNPKTHIRNLVSNVAMMGTTKVKNAMARTMEMALPAESRTKTWKKPTQVVSDFAKQTTVEMKDIITGEGKYSEKGSIESKKQIFKSKTLEKLSDFNSNALSAEDWFFSKRAFESSLREYLTAQGIKTQTDIENNSQIVEKAKMYALEQSEIATFRQYSWLANQIGKIERKNAGTKLLVGSMLPFKKTPINVAKAGVKYSPIGLIKSISYDAFQLKRGNIEASQFIDNLAQGMTGTSLALLGYALAKAGILNGAGDDDKEGKYDYYLGKQSYSLKVGGKTFSISWLSPVAMPLLVGANAYEKLEEGEDWDMNVIVDTLAQTLDPLSEMSFVSSLTDVLQSYQMGSAQMISEMGQNITQNYISQFFPTLFSQLASTLDDTKRSTSASKNSPWKFGEETIRKIMYKIPGLRNQLEAGTDIWGNEIKQNENIVMRAVENFLAPYTVKNDTTDYLDRELKKIYNQTGETGVIPGIPQGYLKYKDETYYMSAEEYTKYKKTYGTIANQYLKQLIGNSNYKNASDEEKATMIEQMYKYSSAKANEKYFESQNIEYSSDVLKDLEAFEELNMNNTQIAEYVSLNKLSSSIKNDDDIDSINKKSEISKLMANSNLNDEQLAYLYEKYYSSEEALKNVMDAKIPVKDFIRFNSQEFTTDYYSNGTAVPNSRKNKVINYVNSLNLSIPQKAMLIKMEYSSYDRYDNQIINYINNMNYTKFEKASILKQFGINSYDTYIINHIKSLNITLQEKTEMLEELGFTVRNGRVYS